MEEQSSVMPADVGFIQFGAADQGGDRRGSHKIKERLRYIGRHVAPAREFINGGELQTIGTAMDALKQEVAESKTIYAYKLVVDNGGAPCISRNTLSLSICKPRIRRDANLDDWIIGFGGKSNPALKNRVIYVAKVTEIAKDGDYYAGGAYRGRPDCIYRRIGSGYEWLRGSRFHGPEDLSHDLGTAPTYDRARSLLSRKFVYFGGNTSPSIDSVRSVYEGLPRDYVRNHTMAIREQLENFIVELIGTYGYGMRGSPTDEDMSRKCYACDDDEDIVLRRC